MLVLALDTTSRAGSSAVARDGQVIAVQPGLASRTHAERLPKDLLDLLARLGFGLGDVDVFAVAAGPGSFTGLRIGLATVQGLAFAARRPVVAVSALDALALLGSSPDQDFLVGAWIDAQRREVFSALYHCGPPVHEAAAEATVIEPASVSGPRAVLERWQTLTGGRPVRFVGDGVVTYRELVVAATVPRGEVVLPAPPLALAIARIATHRAAKGLATAPHAIQPVYVRRPDAALARER